MKIKIVYCITVLYTMLSYGTTYQDAGVNIAAADNFVQYIRNLTQQKEIGAFGASIDITQYNYRNPLLICGTDGVGTKLLIAQEAGIHNTIGIDLVAMSVNDILVHGARPIGFLDYIETGKLEEKTAQEIKTIM